MRLLLLLDSISKISCATYMKVFILQLTWRTGTWNTRPLKSLYTLSGGGSKGDLYRLPAHQLTKDKWWRRSGSAWL